MVNCNVLNAKWLRIERETSGANLSALFYRRSNTDLVEQASAI
jgi:hypothetical protein